MTASLQDRIAAALEPLPPIEEWTRPWAMHKRAEELQALLRECRDRIAELERQLDTLASANFRTHFGSVGTS